MRRFMELALATTVGTLVLLLSVGSWRDAATSIVFPSSEHSIAGESNSSSSPVELQFIHIPKTGGTSIELWGKANGFRWGKYDKSLEGDKKHGVIRCNSWHTPQSVSMESFCVFRRPFERLQSEFRHRACEKEAKMGCDVAFFNAWARKILNGPLDANDCHVLPQRAYLTFCDNVLVFDELQGQFSKLLERHGYSVADTILEVVRQPRKHQRSDCEPDCTIDYETLDDDVRTRFETVYQDDIKLWRGYATRRLRSLRGLEHHFRWSANHQRVYGNHLDRPCGDS